MATQEAGIVMLDGNTAAATIAHALSEVCAIYPITPSSPMGETADELSAAGVTNIWGTVPRIIEMQSEAGAAATLHGAITSGALATTFTASQGLLLMIPTMYKIAGELTPTVFHVSARALACQALSIFGDHSDVMAVRQTGFALLASSSVQEVCDLATIAHASTLESRVPFLHFFDGFRTSHEVQKISMVTRDVLRALIKEEWVTAHRRRGLSPDAPRIRGTSQNPDVYFQGRETVNRYYLATPSLVQKNMDRFAELTGRHYHLFDYAGHPEAERVIVVMGSAAETVHEVVDYLCQNGEKVGVIKVRLFRPFDRQAFLALLPPTVRAMAVLDRSKEPSAPGEPLYLDVSNAIREALEDHSLKPDKPPRIVGGRYGLGSKDVTPAMIKAVLDNLQAPQPKNRFSVGINDDVTHQSLEVDASWQIQHPGRVECIFFGLGSDGTVSANKNSIKIIGDDTDQFAQGYFVYDSKKAGAMTISHLRFGPQRIRSPYLCTQADFVACHNFSFVEKYDLLAAAKPGAVFLLNAPYSAETVWEHLPDELAEQIIQKRIRFYVIDAVRLATQHGLGARINTIMQTCFFALSGILPRDKALESLKNAIRETYGKKGDKVVESNFRVVDAALSALQEVRVPARPAGKQRRVPVVPPDAPPFVQEVTAVLLQQQGDRLPVSRIPDDGTWPTGTTRYEKRNIAIEIPEWNPALCIQCATCSFVCPHAAIRVKIYDAGHLACAPASFQSVDAKGKGFEGKKFTVQVAPEDCTGCGLCVEACPGREKDKATRQETGRRAIQMVPQIPVREREARHFAFFLTLPELDPSLYDQETVKGSQLSTPLFEFSGACAGCGETPYVKLLTQLFGDRLMIGNATGCSSIYGGNLPTTPYCTRADGRGPTWSNSLFEDAAEFALGMRLAVDNFRDQAGACLERILKGSVACSHPPVDLIREILEADQSTQPAIEAQRRRVSRLKDWARACPCEACRSLLFLADYLVRKSVWAVGGDGWAYDIGYGGLDHVLASRHKVNLLVLDTEVYSNTGGQASKSTPIGAVAKFAESGKPTMKKDLGLMAMTYGHVYVATVAIGANRAQTVKAFVEAEAHDGPSLVIAYSHCIAHGIDMRRGLDHQKEAVLSGHFPLYRYNPALAKEGKNPLTLDSAAPTLKFSEHAVKENRFRMLTKTDPESSRALLAEADQQVAARFARLQKLASP